MHIRMCVCVYIYKNVYAEHLPLFETILVWAYIFLLLYSTLTSVKIRMFWMRWISRIWCVPIPNESSSDKRQYLMLIRDFTFCRNEVDLQWKVFALKQQLMIHRSQPCCLAYSFERKMFVSWRCNFNCNNYLTSW